MIDYLTPPQVAKELRVSPDTVRAWVASKALYAVNLGKGKVRPRIRITRESLDAFISTRSVSALAATKRRPARGEYTEYYK